MLVLRFSWHFISGVLRKFSYKIRRLCLDSDLSCPLLSSFLVPGWPIRQPKLRGHIGKELLAQIPLLLRLGHLEHSGFLNRFLHFKYSNSVVWMMRLTMLLQELLWSTFLFHDPLGFLRGCRHQLVCKHLFYSMRHQINWILQARLYITRYIAHNGWWRLCIKSLVQFKIRHFPLGRIKRALSIESQRFSPTAVIHRLLYDWPRNAVLEASHGRRGEINATLPELIRFTPVELLDQLSVIRTLL